MTPGELVRELRKRLDKRDRELWNATEGLSARIEAMEKVCRAACRYRLGVKPTSMTEAEFWASPQLNTLYFDGVDGARDLIDLHKALAALDAIDGGSK